MLRLLLILAAVGSFFLCAAEAAAQSLGQTNPVQFTVTPETPGPGDPVRIDVAGVGTFLGDATITWKQNGSTVLSGVGERSYTFTAGPVGSKTVISVTINSSTQGTISNTFTFTPSSIYLLWEADTSTPWWYKGKALYSGGANLTVVALPQVVSGGRAVSSGSLSYQWSVNGTPFPQSSGTGRSRFTFTGNQLLPSETVNVKVLYGGTAVGEANVTIPASKPLVELYVRDPLRGTLFDQALQTQTSLNSNEFTVEAAPFYFSNSSIGSGAAAFAWTLDGSDASGPQSAQGLLTLRQSGSGSGEAQLRVEVQNTDSSKYVQAAQNALTILFGGSTGASAFSSFFGL